MVADRAGGGGALHELGNLLAVIAGRAEFLLHQEAAVDPRTTVETLTAIRDAALRGREKLREISALTRLPDPAGAAAPSGGPSRAAVRVLLIDDDEDVRTVMADLLRQAGHHVVTAANAKTGLACCEVEPFDCVLTDLTMPDMSGLAVSRIIKHRTPSVFVIVMTGDEPTNAELYKIAGVDRVLLKPCGRQEILAAVAASRPSSSP